ncbi:MAG: PA0069 family radical SAM protein, partial [bacterium]
MPSPPGLKRVWNPPNPYLSQHRELLGEPPPAELEVWEDSSKSILSENDSPDVGFRWSVNPYRGCFHACAYCYARRTHEYLGLGAGTDFERKILVKPRAPELLDAAFRKPSWRGELVAFSGVTDCYQPLEASWKLTRGCLEVCVRWENPVVVVTKSQLVRRDVDLLKQLADRAWVN